MMKMDLTIEVTIEQAAQTLKSSTGDEIVVVGFETCRCFQESRHATIVLPCPCIVVEMKNRAEFREKIPPFQAAILASQMLNEEDARNLQNHKTSPFVFVKKHNKVRFLGGNKALQKWLKDNKAAAEALPEGWETFKDSTDSIFYYNTNTGESTRDDPRRAVAVPAPPHSAHPPASSLRV